MQKLTSSQIRCLLTMQRVSVNGFARTARIARELGISKVSVHNMLNVLISMGLVDRGDYGAASFTELGRETTEQYAMRCDAVLRRLRVAFPELRDAYSVACMLLPEIPDEQLAEILE